MENQTLKVGDFVQLQAGRTPKMQISSIDESKQTALCVWYDPQKRKHHTESLPLNVLTLFPALASKSSLSYEEIIKPFMR